MRNVQNIKRVACAVSGGVDSAMSAYMVKQRGFDVTGIFMKNWDQSNETGNCTQDVDRDYAKFVCNKLDIPLVEVNFVKEYWNEVFSELIEGYNRGISPNVDVLCNKHIKFGHLFKYVSENLGADALATGHYARHSFGSFLEDFHMEAPGASLLTAKDPIKDQTVFLSQMPQEALQRTMFPIGNMMKSEVKQMALRLGFEEVVKKKESMGICFIGKREFRDFMKEYLDSNPGVFIDVDDGSVVGRHDGIHLWTVGQRALIGGRSKAFYILKRDPETQNIYVALGKDNPALFSDSFTTHTPHWIRSVPEGLGNKKCRLSYKFQHCMPQYPCEVSSCNDGALHVALDKPYRAVSPGQYAVFYKGDECLGSAQIREPGHYSKISEILQMVS